MLFDRMNLQFFAEPTAPAPTPQGENKPNEGAKTFTQVDLDRVVADRLEREKKKYADYTDLKNKALELEKLKADQMTEVEKLKAELDKAQKFALEASEKTKAMELKALKVTLAQAAGLPVEIADRISGDDETSINADIETLKPLFKAKGIGGGGVPAGGKDPTSAEPGSYGKKIAEEQAAIAKNTAEAAKSFFKLSK